MRLWERLRRRRAASPPLPYDVGPSQAFDHLRRRRTKAGFDDMLRCEVCDLEKLRKMAWNGIPSENRSLVWMVLLGYVPLHLNRREQTLLRKRSEFAEATSTLFDVPANSRSRRDAGTLRQILVDAPRTCPSLPLFAHKDIQALMIKVLFVWSLKHPASGYVQGMNDLLAVIVLVFVDAALAERRQSSFNDVFHDEEHVPAAEPTSSATKRLKPVLQCDRIDASRLSDSVLDDIAADAYYCFSKILDTIHDQYTHGQPGLRRATNQVSGLLRRVDSELAKHLDQECMPMLQICFRWLNCLLTRELPLRAIVRLWDTCIAEAQGFEKFFPYVCAAFLCHFSETLRQLQAEDLHLFLQDLPTKDWTDDDVETLLSEAFILSTLFQDAPNHLAETPDDDDVDVLAGTG